MLREEAGHVLNMHIKSLKHEKGRIKTKISQDDYNTNRANAKRIPETAYLENLKLPKRNSSN